MLRGGLCKATMVYVIQIRTKGLGNAHMHAVLLLFATQTCQVHFF